MAEIKHTFTGGKMNKDLDERLIKNGEYIHAMNIQVKTTDLGGDGFGAAGTVQNLKGNSLHGNAYWASWMGNQVAPTTWEEFYAGGMDQLPKCVAAVADEKNDRAFFFFATRMTLPNFLSPSAGVGTNERIWIDSIIEQRTDGTSIPVVVDYFAIVNTFNETLGVTPNSSTFPETGWSEIPVADGTKYKPGMYINILNSSGQNIAIDNQGNNLNIRIKAIQGNTLLLHEECTINLFTEGAAWLWAVGPDRVLNFQRGWEAGAESNQLRHAYNPITGINVIDNLLFWTDGNTEPKKINIDRCKAGTTSLDRPTKLFIEDPSTGTMTSVAQTDNLLYQDGPNEGATVNPYLRERHVTVLRKAPKTPPTLHMKSSDRVSVTNITVLNYEFTDYQYNTSVDSGEIYTITGVPNSQFRKDDILDINNFTGDNIPGGGRIKAKFICYEDDENEEVFEATSNIRIKVISANSISESMSSWLINLEQKKPLFELKLARFGYRYKYADGEYSTFSPWSEIAFLPGSFNYDPGNAYNLGMVNNVRELIIKDFIPYNRPLDVVAVDILYKTTDSPNVYIVDTIEKVKNPEWELFTPDGGDNTIEIQTGQLTVTSEMIHRILDKDQLLRSWDNVPRFAKAQEIVGNRILYGNYVQGYDIKENLNITQELESDIDVGLDSPKKSVKTLRDYKIGAVFGDKYGRETPVITSGYTTADSSDEGYSSITGDISVPKTLSAMSNSFIVSQSWGGVDDGAETPPPEWLMDGGYVKYYVKETSNEYYNLMMDRWYESGDNDTIWISFNSADRNKVDEESYLILKNVNGSDQPVLEEARYKVIAIENEAPFYIKTDRVEIGEISSVLPATTGSYTSEGVIIPGSMWPTTVSDDAPQNNEASGLWTDTSLMIRGDSWNTSGIGKYESDQSVFGRALEGKVQIQIVGANMADDGTGNLITTAELVSQWRTLVSFTPSQIGNGDMYVSLMWDKKFTEADVDMRQRFLDLASDAYQTTQLHYHIRFREAITQNKPEFDGKFFVKIKKDFTTETAIQTFGSGLKWTPTNTYPLHYIESTRQTAAQGTLAEGISGTADFQSEDWFYGAFEKFIDTSSDFTEDEQDLFDQASTYLINPYNGSENMADPVCGTTAYDYNSSELCQILNEDGSMGDNQGGVNWTQFKLSPFGSCSNNYNTMTKDFWQSWYAANENQVFIDGCAMALMDIVPGPSRNTEVDPLITVAPDGGPAGAAENYEYARPQSMSVGEAIVAGVSGPAVGVGSMALSFISNSVWATDNEPPLFAALKQPNTVFRFQNHPDQEKIFRVHAVFYKSQPMSLQRNWRGWWAGSRETPMGAGTTQYEFGVPTTEGAIVSSVFETDLWQEDENVGIWEQQWWWGHAFELDSTDDFNLCYIYQPDLSSGEMEVVTAPQFMRGGFGDEDAGDFVSVRHTMYVEFRRVIFENAGPTADGLDLDEYDPRAHMHHDGRDSVNIEILEMSSYTLDGEDTSNENAFNLKAACFETEPKEDLDLELYYEASSAVPMVLNDENAFDFAPINSPVSISRLIGSKRANIPFTLPKRFGYHKVSNIKFAQHSRHAIITIVSDDFDVSEDVNQMRLHKHDFALGDWISFKHNNGQTTTGVIKQMYEPVDHSPDDNFTNIGIDDTYYGIVSGPKAFKPISTFSKSFMKPSGYPSDMLPMESSWASDLPTTNDYVHSISQVDADGVEQTISIPNGLKVTEVSDYDAYAEAFLITFSSPLTQLTDWIDAESPVQIDFYNPSGYYGIDINVWNQPVKLPWHNCWTFGNGVESDRVRDDFNAPQLDNGVKVSSTFSGYGRESISSGLIYSGLYNSTTEINNLNEFNMAEKITKELNPSYGSIQALKTRDTDVVVFTEDKVLKIQSNKDALYNADGNAQLIASNRVLGTAIPFVGDYGISKNPESLAWDQYRMYFTDRQRGAVLRLSQDGLTPISEIGMKAWFRDTMKDTTHLLGTFDKVTEEYNLTYERLGNKATISFHEPSKGWTSFKSYTPDAGLSVSDKYLTATKNEIWKHHDDDVSRNSFYGEPTAASSVAMVFNDSPSVVKSFKTINYEGSQARIVQNAFSENAITYSGEIMFDSDGLPDFPIMSTVDVTDNEYYNLISKDGWWVPNIFTDLSHYYGGTVQEFIPKEGKWFNKITGHTSTLLQDENFIGYNTSNFTVQGIGQTTAVLYTGVNPGEEGMCYNDVVQLIDCCSVDCYDGPCLDPNSEECDDGGSGPTVIFGCTNPNAENYIGDDIMNNPDYTVVDDGSCNLGPCGCAYEYDPNYNTCTDCMCAPNCNFGCMDDGSYDCSLTPGEPALNYSASNDLNGVFVGPVFYDMGPCYNCTYPLVCPDGEVEDNGVCVPLGCADANDLLNEDGECFAPIYGCTDPTDSYYNPFATHSCHYNQPCNMDNGDDCLAPDSCETANQFGRLSEQATIFGFENYVVGFYWDNFATGAIDLYQWWMQMDYMPNAPWCTVDPNWDFSIPPEDNWQAQTICIADDTEAWFTEFSGAPNGLQFKFISNPDTYGSPSATAHEHNGEVVNLYALTPYTDVWVARGVGFSQDLQAQYETLVNSSGPGYAENYIQGCICCKGDGDGGETITYGCTDDNACNYNPDANVSDGSCEYMECLTGCLDPLSDNYNQGCTNWMGVTVDCLYACDNNDNGIYNEYGGDCCDVPVWEEIAGCMSPTAINDTFNEFALISCQDAGVGCVQDDPLNNWCVCCEFPDETSTNSECFDAWMAEDYEFVNFEGNCMGCMDTTLGVNPSEQGNDQNGNPCNIGECGDVDNPTGYYALNFNEQAIFSINPTTLENYPCEYPEISEDIPGCLDVYYMEYAATDNPWGNTFATVHDESYCVTPLVIGCTDEEACNFGNNVDYYGDAIDGVVNVPCDFSGETQNWIIMQAFELNCCEAVVPGCIESGNFNYAGVGNNIGVDPPANADCSGVCGGDDNSCCVGLSFGCMDPLALNYDENAIYMAGYNGEWIWQITTASCGTGGEGIICDEVGCRFYGWDDDGNQIPCDETIGCDDPSVTCYEIYGTCEDISACCEYPPHYNLEVRNFGYIEPVTLESGDEGEIGFDGSNYQSDLHDNPDFPVED